MQEFTVQLFDDGSAQIGGTGANLELRFGYSKNAHMYSVKFIRSKEWEDLYIRVHFHPEADIYDVEPVLAQNNIVNIPATVTSMPGKGKLTIEGTDGYKTITSADIPYRVSENSGIDSETDPEPGESSFQQFVDAVKEDAESATQAAKDAGDILKETKEVSASALTDIETAKANAISEIEKIETEVKGEIQEDVDSSKSSAEAAAKSAEEAKTAADSAKKSLSDLETAKQSAISDISKEKDTSVSAVSSAKEAALNEISKSSDSAVKSVKTAETNAVSAVESEGSIQKTALSNASSAALTSIETAKTNAVKAVEDKASEESLAIDEKASQVIGSVQNAGDAQLLAIGQATNSSIEQITQNAGQHLTQIDSAADEAVTDVLDAKEDSLSELEAVNAHPPIQNSETGKWQVYNSETASYVDTEYDWEGGYYSPSVDSEGNLTWESSKEGMEDIPSSNIRGPQGLGVPTPTANDYGKAPTVNAAGNGYELTGPYAPLSAAIIETAKGNPAVCEDSVEWGLQGVRVYGKSTQDGTPSPENPVPIASAGEGGSVELLITGGNICPTSKGTTNFITNCFVVAETQYTICAKQNVTTNFAIQIRDKNDNIITSVTINSYTAPTWATSGYATFTAPKSGKVFINSFADCEWYELAIYLGALNSRQYEPYKSQFLTISTPNGLPGVRVSKNGNYTDPSGQQFLANYRDWERGVDVQMCCDVVLDGTSGAGFDNNGTWLMQPSDQKDLFGGVLIFNQEFQEAFSDRFEIQSVDYQTAKSQTFYVAVDGIACSMSTSFFETPNIDGFKAYFKANPTRFVVPYVSPVETPIPPEELAAYRVLHTYDSTTVITPDDALAEVEVDYLVKSKAYIEKKLTAIESRLNALEISEALEGE